MSPTCTVCRHAEQKAIDLLLAEGETSRNIAKRYGITHVSVHRHSKHIGAALQAHDRAKAVSALTHAEWLVGKLRKLAEDQIIPRQFLEVADKLDRSIRTYGLIRGEIQTGATVNVFTHLGVTMQEAERAVKVYQSSAVEPEELERRAIDFLTERGYRCRKEAEHAA